VCSGERVTWTLLASVFNSCTDTAYLKEKHWLARVLLFNKQSFYNKILQCYKQACIYHTVTQAVIASSLEKHVMFWDDP